MNVPWGQWTQAWLDNLLAWMSCVWTTAFRQNLLPGAQQYQIPVLYCHLRWGVENAEQLIANQKVLGRIASCRHQAGIWTGLKSSHSTSVCLHKHAHTHTQHVHAHCSLSWGHSCLTAAKPHLCEHRNCNPPFTLSQLVPIYKVSQYCFQQRCTFAYGAWYICLTYE